MNFSLFAAVAAALLAACAISCGDTTNTAKPTADAPAFTNVRRAVHGIARYVASQKPKGARVIVGRDPRFLGETFCSIAS